MANEVQAKGGTAICLGDSGSFDPADDGINFVPGLTTITDAITLASLADGSGRQSDKIDLNDMVSGTNTWPGRIDVMAAFDWTGETPTSGARVDLYWAPSSHATQGNGNVAGNSGADAAAPGGATPSGITLAEFVRQCIFIGSLYTSDDGAVQGGYIGRFEPPTQWGQIVVVNNSGDALEADDVENHVVLFPVLDEIQ